MALDPLTPAQIHCALNHLNNDLNNKLCIKSVLLPGFLVTAPAAKDRGV